DDFKIGSIGTVRDGCVDIVILRPGQVVRVASAMIWIECKSVEMHHEALTQAFPGDNTVFNLKIISVKDMKRVFAFGDSKQDPTTRG
ncbi:MAG: putative eukaryotic translation elongation factor 1 alpha 2, partial [Streblomastix strix]